MKGPEKGGKEERTGGGPQTPEKGYDGQGRTLLLEDRLDLGLETPRKTHVPRPHLRDSPILAKASSHFLEPKPCSSARSKNFASPKCRGPA